MGAACDVVCNGTQTPMDSGLCVCDDNCTHGDNCLDTCSSRGLCTNGACDCKNQTSGINDGYWGPYCAEVSCPGTDTVCNSHGTCNKVRTNR